MAAPAVAVVFLDVDGVLQAHNAEWFSMTALKLLRQIVLRSDAKIVLSSTWRLLAQTRQLVAERLKLVRLEIFDVTPRSVGGGSGNRAQEIAQWLDDARVRRSLTVDRFVVLDDRDVAALQPVPFEGHCVLVNPFTGLRFCDYVDALRILGVEAGQEETETLTSSRSVSIDNLQALLEQAPAPIAAADDDDDDSPHWNNV